MIAMKKGMRMVDDWDDIYLFFSFSFFFLIF